MFGSWKVQNKSIGPELLRLALKDKDAKVRQIALYSLNSSYSDTPNLLPAMLAILDKEENENTRAGVIWAFVNGHGKDVDTLLSAMKYARGGVLAANL